jgi:site-specific recombinase XerD
VETSVLELRNLIQGFKLSCQTEGKSPKTIEWYTSFLTRFLQFLSSRGYPLSISQIDKNHIREFVKYLQLEAKTPHLGKSLSQATIQGYVRTLKSFFSWALREEYLDSNPMVRIPIPKATIKVVNTLSHDQIATLLMLCQNSNGLGYRNFTIMLLLLDSGIRVSELVNIDLEDINLTEGSIKIRRAKGNKERLVPMGSLVQRALWKYINHYRPQSLNDKITKLFLSEDGVPLTKNGVQQMLRRYGKRAGITGVRCSPHTFRHTFAKNYLLNGGDIFSLQKILGHSSLASVRLYLNLFASDVKSQHKRFSPVDNMTQSRSLYPLIRSNNRSRSQ